ncbi:MAG: hypothetical protein HYY09_05065 [Firmicutes bacterium]|nr:hypothetical protein [Bacillota bacterium]
MRALMALLVARYGKGFESRVFVEGGGLNNLARVLVGEVEVPELPVGMDTALEPGSVVTIITITALAGGENLDPGVHEGPGQRHGIRVDQS